MPLLSMTGDTYAMVRVLEYKFFGEGLFVWLDWVMLAVEELWIRMQGEGGIVAVGDILGRCCFAVLMLLG